MWVQRGHDPTPFRIFVPHLALRRGTITALVGRSGSGKSTVLEALAFLRRALLEGGSFRVATRDGTGLEDVTEAVATWQADRLARQRARSIGYVPQTHVLLPFVSARANMLLAVPEGHPAEAAERVEELARALDIHELLDRLPEQLSVGQRQRVAIGRALAAGAPVLLVDEPTAALDRANAEAVGRLLVASARSRNVAVLVATHDDELVRLCDRRFVIRFTEDRAEVCPMSTDRV